MAFSDVEKSFAKRTVKQYCSDWSELRYDESHNKPYFIGRRNKDSPTEVIFPIDANKVMSFEEIKACIVDSGVSSVNLAIYSSDSSVVMCKAHLDLPSVNVNSALQSPDSSAKEKVTESNPNNRSKSPVCSEAASSSDCLPVDPLPTDVSNLSDTQNDQK